MENTNNKIMTLSYMVAGILTWVVVRVLVGTFGGMVSGSMGQALQTPVAMEIAPALLGIVVWAVLQTNKKVNVWADEVVSEIRKVVWPSRKDTVAMTIVVCMMLLIAGFVVGGFDIVSSYTIDWLLTL